MKKSSEKSFGILFFVIFLLFSLWPLLSGNSLRIWSFFISMTFLIIAFQRPEYLKSLNAAWIKIGEVLGKIIAPIVMAFIYFFVLTPLSILIRILGKDLLKLKFSKNASYWIKRDKNINSMDKQF
jgi:hypothetical protein